MEQMSLTDFIEESTEKTENQLDVVKAEFIQTEKTDWEKLFSGFDELHAITYSSGLEFTCKLVNMFSYSEIIFGCEDVVSTGIASVMAVQQSLVERIAKSRSAGDLSQLMEDDKLKLFVSRDIKSHEKIFCLKADDGRVRVITGSANMSASAFCGYQRENITYYDDQEAYDWYMERFIDFREQCADNVNHQALVAVSDDEDYLSENPEELPILKTIAEKKLVFVEPASEEDAVEIALIADIKGHEDEIKPMLPKLKKDQGKIVFPFESIRTFTKKRSEQHDIKKRREKQLPKLHLDFDTKTMNFNGKECCLNPDKEKIRNDIRFLFSFMSSFESFYGDVLQAQKDYFAFMNWYFASVFMPYLRYIAQIYNYNVEQQFPVVGIIYGESNGGKSTFVKLLSKMMSNVRINQNSSVDFTSTNIENLKRACEGIPIFIDDLDKTQFQNHNEKIIKNDAWGIAERFINYPSIVITTNSLPALKDYISKRAIGCRINIKIEKETGLHNAKKLNESLKHVTNSFFCEYVRRMFDRISVMEANMKSDEVDYFPDIFKVSSEVIVDIMKEYSDVPMPEYVRVLSHSDYFGERVVGRNPIEKIIRAWENEPKQFTVDRKKNKLIYTYPQNANTYGLQYINDELPPKLNSHINSHTLSMDLDAAEEFFGRKFKKRFWR
ncbi:MAG: phospholipase D family protein [Lachnospiraceae bacterium]|nr:phospholipase D family protein [Lachnospiraceae bacterium]